MANTFRLPGSSNFGDAAYWSIALASTQDVFVMDGIDHYTSGLDHVGKDFASMTFGPNYGNASTVIGDTGAPLKFDASGGSAKVKFAGQCSLFALSAGTGGTINQIEFYPQNPSARLKLVSNTANPVLIGDSGQIEVGESFAFTTGRFHGGDHIIRAHASNVPTNIYAANCRLLLERDWATLYVLGDADITIKLPTGTTGGNINLWAGAKGVLRILAGDGGTLEGVSGEIDLGKLSRAAAWTAFNLYSGSKKRTKQGGPVVTTTENEFGRGPKRIVD